MEHSVDAAAPSASFGPMEPVTFGSFRLHASLCTEPAPQMLNFEVTNFCNLRCSHCGHSQYPEFVKGHTDEALFEALVPYLGAGKVANLGLTSYGEVLLSPRLWPILDRAKAIPGLGIRFVTNAVLLDRHLDRLTYPGLGVVVSMDGASEATYGHFRGKGHFDKVVRNLAVLRERELAGTVPPTNRSFNVALSQVNVHEMPEIVELASSLDVRSVVFFFQVFFDEAAFRRESLYFAREKYDHWLRLALDAGARRGVEVVHTDSFDGTIRMSDEARRGVLYRDARGRTRCGIVEYNSYVLYHGQVEACCVPDRHILGNLHENTFGDIWWGHTYRRLRHTFRRATWPLACRNCHVFQALDLDDLQSHYVKPMRDDGRLHSWPQPYSVTELDREFRALTARLTDGAAAERLMPDFQRLMGRDAELHEVANAIGVLWLALGQPGHGRAVLADARAMAPDDPVLQHNLAAAGAPSPPATPATRVPLPLLGAGVMS